MEGVHDVDVTVEVVDLRRHPQRRPPRSCVQLDRAAEKDVPVRADVMDTTAFGYDWQPPLVTPMTVTVRGLQTQVDQVSAATAEVFLRNAKNQVERTETLVAQKCSGAASPVPSCPPAEVRAIVPVEEWPGRKEVAVQPTSTASLPSATASAPCA